MTNNLQRSQNRQCLNNFSLLEGAIVGFGPYTHQIWSLLHYEHIRK